MDVHAFSHIFEGDDQNEIENCQSCEEYVVSNQHKVSILPQPIYFSSCDFNANEETKLNSTKYIYINQAKYLGKFHNKPPPTAI